ncbi:MAG: Sua5/YciO/YrdC/YwlC family protein [Planctomycetota bacterium]|jgi:tRNA threonylcarbamoyl adenosine modification protein (Sua5/YciO/YrdC/YwlC family)|nr:Sua5/YciO/YrdC/YwlC family protein [Planctomycetota bacterium]MDP6762954.1 Sua5/YciO/YrdC/YwlC family protein [Planctomycetota bacterium]MDP6987866.1 Sua5/YciO/YrdC/YwlC family protein [Planctomycetota bacterium]
MSSSPSSPSPRITHAGGAAGAALTERVGTALGDGALVVLPTETVYGIAARADSGRALDALAAFKQRPAEQGWTWHVGGGDALERFDAPSPLARRLSERFWPGPLTLVLPGVPAGLEAAARDGWTGVRRVAHPLTAEVLGSLPFPAVMTSANARGAPPATDGDSAEAATRGAVDLVVDAGPSRDGAASSVLRLGRGRFELLREGACDLESLRRAAGLRIAFACTGNTCRSPMALGLGRRALARRLEADDERLAEFGFELSSFGVFAGEGSPASGNAVEACRQRGIDIARHRSRGLHADQLAGLERVYCMTRAHVDALRLLAVGSDGPAIALLDPDGADVPDPIGGSLHEYQRCAEHILGCIAERLEEWA